MDGTPGGVSSDLDLIRKLERLAALSGADGGKELAGELARMIAFAGRVRDFPDSGPTQACSSVTLDALRADEPCASQRADEALANAPQVERDHFAVPPMMTS